MVWTAGHGLSASWGRWQGHRDTFEQVLGFQAVALGGYHAAALQADRTVWTAGTAPTAS